MMRKAIRALIPSLMLLFAASAAFGQSSASNYTTGYRFDALQRLTGVIKPDPDGAGALKFAAERYTYDDDGLLLSQESGQLANWKPQSTAPANWGSDFTVLETTAYTYDGVGRKLTQRVKGSNGTTYSLTQYSYDDAGRVLCTAVRMNESVFGSPPTNVCAPGTAGTNGPDRITQNFYDAASQLVQVHQAVGTSIEQAYVTYGFTANGKQEHVIDANGNRAKLEYDGFDRQTKWIFPSTSKPASFNPASPTTALATAGSVNAGDYEQYGYDAGGNRTSLRKRDTTVLTYQYDALNRMILKAVPDTRPELDGSYTRDVYYSYDLLGSQTSARFDNTGGAGLISAYDGFGRLSTATDGLLSGSPPLAYQYDRNGNRTRITHPDGTAFDMTFDGLNRMVQVKKGSTVLAAPSYNNRGLASTIDRYNAALDQAFTYDPVGRLATLAQQTGSNSSNVSWTFARNPASQIKSEVRTNDAYAWTGRVDANSPYTTNGLNQYSEIGSINFCYDANGNLTADDEYAYLYDVENRLVEKHDRVSPSACPGASSGYTGDFAATLHYDPMGRLYEVVKYTNNTPTNIARFLNDGDAMVLEYDGANAIVSRFVHGNDAGADDPLVWYPTSSTADSNIRNLYPDPRGSIVLVQSQDGTAVNTINTYDEWGANDGTNAGRFQYTGQVWLPEIGMYYYKARIYSQRLGRFMQADPVGYKDQINLYAYVGNDPIDRVDPSGTEIILTGSKKEQKEFLKIASKITGHKVTVDKNGRVQIGAATKSGNAEAAKSMSAAISSTSSFTVDAVSNDATTFGDGFFTDKFDNGDFKVFNKIDAKFAAALFTHVMVERTVAAPVGGPTQANFPGAHSAASSAEAGVMGNGAVTRTNSGSPPPNPGTVTFDYRDLSGQIVNSVIVKIEKGGKLSK